MNSSFVTHKGNKQLVGLALIPFYIVYAQDLELEKLIGLSMRWCGAYRSVSNFKKYVKNISA